MRTVLAFLLAATASATQSRAPGNDTLLEDELLSDLFFLASDASSE